MYFDLIVIAGVSIVDLGCCQMNFLLTEITIEKSLGTVTLVKYRQICNLEPRASSLWLSEVTGAEALGTTVRGWTDMSIKIKLLQISCVTIKLI